MAGKKQLFDVDPDAPPSEEELAESAKLRDALADPSKASDEAELLRALAHAHAPRAIEPADHRAIVERAIAGAAPARRSGVVVRVAFGVAAVFAAAALVVLFLRTRLPRPQTTAAAELAVTRSTQPLFDEPFAAEGGQSARIDRIAMARAGDLRENRFARWGVR